MARIQIPKNPGKFTIVITTANSYAVTNDKSGGGRIIIPCKSYEQAVKLCKKLNEKDHDGEVWM